MPKRRGRPAGSKNKPKLPATVPAADAGGGGQPQPASAVPAQPEPEPEPKPKQRPLHLTPSQVRMMRQISRQNRFEQLAMANSMDV